MRVCMLSSAVVCQTACAAGRCLVWFGWLPGCLFGFGWKNAFSLSVCVYICVSAHV